MSPALPVVSGPQAVAALRKGGFEQVSQRGSHVKLRAGDGRVAIVPMHRASAVPLGPDLGVAVAEHERRTDDQKVIVRIAESRAAQISIGANNLI